MSKCSKLTRDLWQAVASDDVDEVKRLLEQGADPNHPLYWSESWTYLFSPWDPDDEPYEEEKYPPLHTACRKNNLEIIKLLHKAGADINKGETTVPSSSDMLKVTKESSSLHVCYFVWFCWLF